MKISFGKWRRAFRFFATHRLRVWLLVAVVCLASILLIHYIVAYDACQGRLITKLMCQQYADGLIAGTLCYEFCKTKTIYISSCMTQQDTFREFYWNGSVIKVDVEVDVTRERLRVPSHGEIREGMPIESFYNMLSYFIRDKLGPSEHLLLFQRIVIMADFNQNGQLSLAEARSIWHLLHINEFFMLVVFQESTSIPDLRGTCGSIYMMEDIPNKILFDKENQGFLGLFSSSAYKLHLPPWHSRINVALGIIEHAMVIYEESETIFYMCEITPKMFGYTSKFEAKISGMQYLIPQTVVAKGLYNKSCKTDNDCSYKPQCQLICDNEQRRCTNMVTRPSLYYLCSMLKEYILYGAPTSSIAELDLELRKCLDLHNRHRNPDIQHSVAINNLKLLLWAHIKDHKFK